MSRVTPPSLRDAVLSMSLNELTLYIFRIMQMLTQESLELSAACRDAETLLGQRHRACAGDFLV